MASHAEFLAESSTLALRANGYIEAAKLALTLAKELGLFGDDSVEESLDEIYAHIAELYSRIAELSVRIEEVREELINLVLQIEYRNIAQDVIKLTSAVGSLSQSGAHGFLDAAFLDIEPNHGKLLERLEENWSSADSIPRFFAYLDLFIVHCATRSVIISGAPSLGKALKKKLLVEQASSFVEIVRHAENRIAAIERLDFEASPCGFLEPFNDDDGTTISADLVYGVYRKSVKSCEPVKKITLYPGGSGAIAHNEKVRAEAIALVNARIDTIVSQIAREKWEVKYGGLI